MIIVVGNLSWDRLFLVDDLPSPNQDVVLNETFEFPGGAAANVSAALGALRNKVGILTCVGKDSKGDFLIQDMTSYGVDCSYIAKVDVRTSEFLAVMDKQGNRNFYLDLRHASFQLSIEHFPAHTSEINGFAFVGCRLDLAKRVVELTKKRKIKLFANIGFWIASQELDIQDVSFLETLDCVFLNHDEFELLPKILQTFLLEEFSTKKIKQLIITSGSSASVVHVNGQIISETPIPLPKLINTLGCGDAFMGGYISGYLSGNSSLECLRLGHKFSSRVAQIVEERTLSVYK